MLFTVVESRDARIKAEWRGPIAVTLTLEGADLGYKVGDQVEIRKSVVPEHLSGCIFPTDFPVVAVGQPAVTVADMDAAESRAVNLGVTHDLSDEVPASPFGTSMAEVEQDAVPDVVPLAEPAPDQ